MDSIWANLNTFVLQRIVHSDSPLHQHHSSYLGYWGKPTSTVDWCENNYEISHYIAEFFNTFSSFAMVIIGVAGIMLHWNQYRLESRFIMGLLGVAVVGFGSAAFHGTLWFGLQMLDELPMIYSALIMSYTMIEHYNVKRKYGYYLPAMLALHAAITTVLVSLPVLAPNYASPILQFIAFHLSFAALEVFLFRSQINIWRQERNPTARRLHLAGFSLWLTGIGCWLMDYLGCEFLWEGENSLRKQFLTHLPNPQYHSWWHVCASGGLYTLTIAVAYHRQSTILGITDTEIVMCYGVLPALRRKLQKSIPKVRVSQTQKSSKAD